MKKILFIIVIMMLALWPTAGTAADKPVSQLTAATTIADDDLFMISYYSGGAYYSRKLTFANLIVKLNTLYQPLSAGTDGTYGQSYNNNTSTFAPASGYSYGMSFIGGYPNAYFGGSNKALLYSGGALGTPASGTLTNCTFPTLNQNSTGYAGGIALVSQASGDLFYASSATALSRLAKGTAYQIPMMNSGATAPTWTSTLGVTGTRLTKIWVTDIEITNLPTVNGVAAGAAGGLSTTIATNTASLGTDAISSGACASAVTVVGTNIATTDIIDWGFAADPTSTTGYSASANGMLTIIAYPTSGNANFKVCNNTAASITPGAVTLNWRVRR